eukprot:TRINITY_DN3517_c0_g1_i4.p1 TRINITY_DN3517_c0_g1~~TRINITY_DN3517_c0_g1_i4.p1  ORF type:complete len:116 (+),score=8.16 TRINITY_DN3517_c0_g1_i4:145-492(+)
MILPPHKEWYNQKRAWLVYVVLVCSTRVFWGVFFASNIAWTITNLVHALVSFYLFHWCKGLPFPHYASREDKLTMWEQLDDEKHFTPTKKLFLLIPACLWRCYSLTTLFRHNCLS